MEIKYALTREDFVSFNMYHIENSKTTKQSLFRQQYVIPIIYLIIPFIFSRVTDIPFIFWMITFLAIFILWIIFYPRYFKNYVKRNIEKMIDEGRNENLFGPVILTLEEAGISETSNSGVSMANWSSIERVEETKTHILIYLNAVSAAIVPLRAFADTDEKNEFLKTLKSYWNKFK
jgi:Ca2+/Na+ antiporter